MDLLFTIILYPRTDPFLCIFFFELPSAVLYEWKVIIWYSLARICFPALNICIFFLTTAAHFFWPYTIVFAFNSLFSAHCSLLFWTKGGLIYVTHFSLRSNHHFLCCPYLVRSLISKTLMHPLSLIPAAI